jgi:hypothetical protein
LGGGDRRIWVQHDDSALDPRVTPRPESQYHLIVGGEYEQAIVVNVWLFANTPSPRCYEVFLGKLECPELSSHPFFGHAFQYEPGDASHNRCGSYFEIAVSIQS